MQRCMSGAVSRVYVSSVAQLCLSLCNPTDCSLPGSSVHEISQGRKLEWIAISVSRGSSPPRDGACDSCSCEGNLHVELKENSEVSLSADTLD